MKIDLKVFHSEWCAVELTVTGQVQGVGYRPFVRREAQRRSLSGYVKNSGGGVQIYACGQKEALNSFVRCLLTSPPIGTVYASFDAHEAERQAVEGFVIAESSDEDLLPMVMPDLAPCADCVHELFDRANRRYRYPFISCAHCGPRFSLQTALPYDRSRTSMARFGLCRSCADEYHATKGRRSYAQTQACPDCGPQLVYHATDGHLFAQDKALDACVAHLKAGGIDAVKNVSGFHLACRADDEEAVCTLRALKGREEKPFALLFADLSAIRGVAEVSDAEEALLISPARPIVLLRRKAQGENLIASSVCRDSLYIGAMLPSSPLQYLLAREVGCLVMTSANRSGEPLCADIAELADWLPSSVGVLDNDRPIVMTQDDSLCFVADCAGEPKPLFLRRARGYAPLPIRLNRSAERPVLAAGGDLKAVFALVKGSLAYLSPYIGDLEDVKTAARWRATLGHMRSLLSTEPMQIACDLHPGYYSRKMAEKQLKLNGNDGKFFEITMKVQHHHAHIASVMAEHGLERVLGFAFDGTGYGCDGTIWGGELLYCEGARFERLMHLQSLPLLGGDSGARDCRRTAATFLLTAGRTPWDDASKLWAASLAAGVGAVRTSSMGRLFDAAASIIDVCHYNAYEGQAAIMLEGTATLWQAQGGEAADLTLAAEGDIWRSDRLLLELFAQKEAGIPTGALALGFHFAVADAVAVAAEMHCRALDCRQVALSGGVFANRILLCACTKRLKAKEIEVYLNEQVPAGDGGIALGQSYLATINNKENI